MKKIVHREETRGHMNYGWLDDRPSFSFGHWHNPERNGFGTLLVMNDDIIAPDSGFGMHPHKDMEIITIPLDGKLTHEDNMGSRSTINSSMVQVMSAGTGVLHSEKNEDEIEAANTLQIWIRPKQLGIQPRYDEKEFDQEARENAWQELVGPDASSLSINQDAKISIAKLEGGKSLDYKASFAGNGSYVFILDGHVECAGEDLHAKDAVGLWETDAFSLKAEKDSLVLCLEVPMEDNIPPVS